MFRVRSFALLPRRQALREVRDRQLGFRHYHDLIVNMSKAVLEDDCNAGGHPGADTAVEEQDRDRCCRAASVGSNTRNNNGGGSTSQRACSTEGFSPRASRSTYLHGLGGGGGGGGGRAAASSSPGGQRFSNRSGSPSCSDRGLRARASPEGRAVAAVSLARSGAGGGGGPSILAALRETAAAGGGVDVRAGVLSRDRGRPRERQQRG